MFKKIKKAYSVNDNKIRQRTALTAFLLVGAVLGAYGLTRLDRPVDLAEVPENLSDSLPD